MSVLIKPCPFCGGKAGIEKEYDTDGFGEFLFVRCGSCRAKSRDKFASETCPQTYAEVRDVWNQRHDASEKLRAALDRQTQLANSLAEERERVKVLEAAPELLAALQELRATIMETRGTDATRALEAADSAIAKALGENQ